VVTFEDQITTSWFISSPRLGLSDGLSVLLTGIVSSFTIVLAEEGCQRETGFAVWGTLEQVLLSVKPILDFQFDEGNIESMVFVLLYCSLNAGSHLFDKFFGICWAFGLL
jgi:hypothetical protein